MAPRKPQQFATCFGLAEEMLRRLEHSDFVHAWLDDEGGASREVFAVHGIIIPVAERGVQKIHAASGLALYAVNEELDHLSQHLEAGYHNRGTNSHFWIDPFDVRDVDFSAARRTLGGLKGLLKEVDDPTAMYSGGTMSGSSHVEALAVEKLLQQILGPDARLPQSAAGFDKRAEGTYWVGPFSDQMVDGVMGLLLEFHNQTGIKSTTFRLPDASNRFYVSCDKAEMTDLMEKEGLLAKGQGRGRLS